jgi:membrane-bound lytic murein transglycosylase D
MKLRAILIVFYSFLALPGCQSMGGPGSAPRVASLAQHSAYPSSPAIHRQFPWPTDARVEIADEQVDQAPADLWERIRSQLSWQDIDNKQVENAVDGYLSQPGYLPEVSERGSLYLYYIVEEVQKRDMPMEIALVPLVESTLDPFAYSPGQAAGLWQIMPTTGEHLGLEQTWWFDGRRAVRDSTRVALDYLEQLHTEFDNDWLLALAAYNAGEGRVARARQANLEKGLPTDFWSLDLPKETRRYVPRILALSQIVAEPENHAVQLPPVADAPAFEVAEIGGQIDLARAAELADVSLETLRELNPGQLRWATAPSQSQELLVPFGTGARLQEELAQLTPAEWVRWHSYIIRPGDNLAGIAKKFHTNVGVLRRVNGIAGSSIRAGRSLMIPGGDWAPGLSITEGPQRLATPYKVRRGDSLYRIAGKYKVSVDDIVAWNSLDPRKHLKPGQTLKLHFSGS